MNVFVRGLYLRYILAFGILLFSNTSLLAQLLGPELIEDGNFGTVETFGKNGDALGGMPLYPDANVLNKDNPNAYNPNVAIYYQQPVRTYSNSGVFGSTPVNKGLVVGRPISNRTTYVWGMNEDWASSPLLFPNKNDSTNTWTKIPHAPNNGHYVIATTTQGMYNTPSLGDKPWPIAVYDRYETDMVNPKNYFMVVNADQDSRKIFYKEEVNVLPGQMYRMSVDVAQLNSGGTVPSIAFIVSEDPNNLSTIAPEKSHVSTKVGEWQTLSFDYQVPCGVTKLYVAFRNNVSGGGGNDLAIDDLSMRLISAAVAPVIASTSGIDFNCAPSLTLKFDNRSAFPATLYNLKWQKENENGVWADIAQQTADTYTLTQPGKYRVVLLPKTSNVTCNITSNTFIVTGSTGCLQIRVPKANDDTYEVLEATELTGDLLNNDEAASTSDALSVVSYEINGTTYSAGNTTMLYNGTTLLGSLTIRHDGTFAFKSVLGLTLPMTMPTVKYTISEENGAKATANLTIKVVKSLSPRVVNVTYDASCLHCPIVVIISGNGIVAGTTYSLYRGDLNKGTFDAASRSLTFNETASGKFAYTIKNAAGEVVHTFNMEVHPSSALWSETALSTSWSEPTNWVVSTGRGSYPIWCTDVTIPSAATTFPLLVDGDAARDITFKADASVGQIQKLTYRKAFVEVNPERNRWYMLTAPLKYMYSADYHGDMSWTNSISPKIFMMYFDVNNEVNPDGRAGYVIGNFSKPFARLEEKLDPAKGYAIWVNGVGNGNSYPDTNFPTGTPYLFPRSVNGAEPTYNYHDTKTGAWLNPTETLNRGDVGNIATDAQWEATKGVLTTAQKDNKYRFNFENQISNNRLTIPVNPGAVNAIGNPFMSHLDFERFVLDNKDNIQGFYRVWDGSKFYLYITDQSANTKWDGLGGLTTETGEGTITQYISPLQSFFVETKPGVTSVVFDAANACGVVTTSKLRSAKVAPANLLNLKLNMGDASSRAVVAVREGASSAFDEDEDIKKLFAPGSEKYRISEIYTLIGEESIEVNLLGNEAESQVIPVGIRSSVIGDGEISVDGALDFDAYESVVLRDAALNTTYDLKKQPTVKFNKTGAADIENRFSIVLSLRNTSSIEDNEADDSGINIYRNQDGALEIESPLVAVKRVEVFDARGLKIADRDGGDRAEMLIGSEFFTTGVYVVKVTAENLTKTVKLLF